MAFVPAIAQRHNRVERTQTHPAKTRKRPPSIISAAKMPRYSFIDATW